ncbi:hypothetical protein NC651_020874 [Populus alba x Populus x berolinensis]|nr:hypothetical protein NC651_020874 [Populus alba x Populus x berolinensis]
MSNQILSRLGPVGHRRGGKTAFALALDKADPVVGKDKGKQTPPPVLAYVPRSFDLDTAIMVIGSGLGEPKRSPLVPSWIMGIWICLMTIRKDLEEKLRGSPGTQ